jgi:hypothetical protein
MAWAIERPWVCAPGTVGNEATHHPRASRSISTSYLVAIAPPGPVRGLAGSSPRVPAPDPLRHTSGPSFGIRHTEPSRAIRAAELPHSRTVSAASGAALGQS